MDSVNHPVAGAVAKRSRAIALSRRILGPIWMRVGFTALLTVRGRQTGTERRVTLFPVEVEGHRYLLSQYGVSDWVLNLRAAGRGDLRHRGRTQALIAIEVDGAERDRVIEAFKVKTPKPFRLDFEQLPGAADHPAFRVEPIG